MYFTACTATVSKRISGMGFSLRNAAHFNFLFLLTENYYQIVGWPVEQRHQLYTLRYIFGYISQFSISTLAIEIYIIKSKEFLVFKQRFHNSLCTEQKISKLKFRKQ